MARVLDLYSDLNIYFLHERENIIVTAYQPDNTLWNNDYTVKKKNMKCVICKNGVTSKGKATVTLERGEFIVVIKGVF